MIHPKTTKYFLSLLFPEPFSLSDPSFGNKTLLLQKIYSIETFSSHFDHTSMIKLFAISLSWRNFDALSFHLWGNNSEIILFSLLNYLMVMLQRKYSLLSPCVEGFEILIWFLEKVKGVSKNKMFTRGGGGGGGWFLFFSGAGSAEM